jgi:uncharacterized protein (DUF58 family)
MVRAEGHICFGLTEAGKMILRGILFVALAALIIPAFDVLSVLVSVVLTALVVGLVLRPRILITGTLPERIIAGQTAHLTYTIRNVGRLPAYHLRVRFRTLPEEIEQTGDAEVIQRLGPGQTAEVAVAIRPKRRGSYDLRPPVGESSFPFNLFRFGRARAGAESLIVLPAFSRLDLPLPYLSRHVNAASLRPAGRRGTSPEYIGNRPFQPGDPPRRIDVRAWARLSVPATKEYDDDLDNYAALILDTRRSAQRQSALATLRKRGVPEPDQIEDLEAAVSLCASVAYTIHPNCLIDLLLAGPDLHALTSLPKVLRLDRIQETLAVVEPSRDYTAEQLAPLLEDRLGEISEAIFIVLHWDHTYQQLAELAQGAGCHCTVIMMGPAEPSDFGLRISDLGLKEAGAAHPQSAIRNPQFPDIRFVAVDEIPAGWGDVL